MTRDEIKAIVDEEWIKYLRGDFGSIGRPPAREAILTAAERCIAAEREACAKQIERLAFDSERPNYSKQLADALRENKP